MGRVEGASHRGDYGLMRIGRRLRVGGFGDPAGATCAGTVCGSLRAPVTTADQAANVGSTVSLGTGTFSLGGSGSAGGPLVISRHTTVAGVSTAASVIRQTGAGDGVITVSQPTATVNACEPDGSPAAVRRAFLGRPRRDQTRPPPAGPRLAGSSTTGPCTWTLSLGVRASTTSALGADQPPGTVHCATERE
jgi:hypothetical protein